MRRPRILWVTKCLGLGGVERLIVGLAKTSLTSMFQINVLYAKDPDVRFISELRDLGVGVRGASDFGRPWPIGLARGVRAETYDLIHTHSPLPAAIVRATSFKRSVPIIHTQHNLWESNRVATRWANRWTFGVNNACLAVSDGVERSIKRHINQRYYSRLEVLYHGFDASRLVDDPDAIGLTRSLVGVSEGDFLMVTVGNLRDQKDHATMIKALPVVLRQVESAHLLIVGDGPRRTNLEELARRLEVADSVTFLGPRSDAVAVVALANVFVMSSRQEGLPIALLEAMALERACVTTAVGGIPEVIVNGKSGLLVPPGDHDALARALVRVAREDSLSRNLGREAKSTVASLSIDVAAQRLVDVYNTHL